jgi:hypothetical protein
MTFLPWIQVLLQSKMKENREANKVKGLFWLNLIVCGALQDFKVLPTTCLLVNLPTGYPIGQTYLYSILNDSLFNF